MLIETSTILIVDDEQSVRMYLRTILERNGFRVLQAVNGCDGLTQLTAADSGIDLLLIDVRMPRMDGLELARRAYLLRPATPVLYVSGYPFDLEQERRLYGERLCAFLMKPFTPAALLEAVHCCLPATRKLPQSAGMPVHKPKTSSSGGGST